MEPTEALRNRLRKMINDLIPEGGTEQGATFTNAELDDVLTESATIQQAAAELWMIKAGLLQGEIKSYSVGNEKYDLVSLKDRLEHALAMARSYQEQVADSDETQGSVLLKFKSPDVI